METMLIALRGPAAFVVARLRGTVSWISASGVVLAADSSYPSNVFGVEAATIRKWARGLS